MDWYTIRESLAEAYSRLANNVHSKTDYAQWLGSDFPKLRTVLPGKDYIQLDQIRARAVSYVTERENLLAAINRLMEEHEREWTDQIYRDADSERDANLEHFVRNWERNREGLLLFLGAGASLGARNPQGMPLPGANELRDLIAGEFLASAQVERMSLEHVAALAQEASSRNDLRDYVQDLLAGAKPLWWHAIIPFMSPMGVFTTNYDTLIEDGWECQAGVPNVRPLTQLLSTNQPSWKDRDSVPIFKPHGSIGVGNNPIGEGGLVLTHFDYFEMVSKHRGLIADYLENFEEVCVLFVGYSLFDMDIGSQLWSKWQTVRNTNNDVKWYAVMPSEPEVASMYYKHLGVRVINRRFHEFLKSLDEAVNFVPPEWKFERIGELLDAGRIG
jgi:hypothetical protein